jgi:hypothetical protein
MLKVILTLSLLAFASGCATIVGLGPNDKVHIESTGTSVAEFTITDGDGKQVAAGRAPMSVKLPAGTHYFQPERYTVHYSKKGYLPTFQTIDTSLNPWYFGNIIFGGIIVGMIIVDPLTGAMWSLEDEVSAHLVKDGTNN